MSEKSENYETSKYTRLVGKPFGEIDFSRGGFGPSAEEQDFVALRLSSASRSYSTLLLVWVHVT